MAALKYASCLHILYSILFVMIFSDSCTSAMPACLWEIFNSRFCRWHGSDFMNRLKRNTACYPLVQVFLFHTCLRATYLVSSHSVAWSKFDKAAVGVPHAVDAVSCFKASDLEKNRLCTFSLSHGKTSVKEFKKFPLLFQTRNSSLPDRYKINLHMTRK